MVLQESVQCRVGAPAAIGRPPGIRARGQSVDEEAGLDRRPYFHCAGLGIVQLSMSLGFKQLSRCRFLRIGERCADNRRSFIIADYLDRSDKSIAASWQRLNEARTCR